MLCSSMMRRSRIWTVGLIIGLTLGAHCEAEDFSRLTLQLQGDQRPLPMEPVRVSVTASNETEQTVVARVGLRPRVSLWFYSGGAEGILRGFRDVRWGDVHILFGKQKLKPDDALVYNDSLYYGRFTGQREGWAHLYPSPGAYRLRAALTQGEREIESNVLRVHVSEPEGVDAEAYAFLKEAGPILLPLTDAGPEVHAERKEFLRRFPDSRYAAHAYYTMGMLYDRSVPRESEKVVSLLEKAGRYEDFSLPIDALKLLITTYAERGEFERAERRLAEMKRRFPHSRHTRSVAHDLRNARRDRP